MSCSEQQAEQSGPPPDVSVTEGEGVAGGEESEDSRTVEEVLTQLSLENLIGTFQKEQIDLDSLVRWGRDSDIGL